MAQMFFPFWLVRLLVTLLIIWLVWVLLIGPWMFSTQSFIEMRYEWMLPGKQPSNSIFDSLSPF